MSYELYIQNLKELEKQLQLPNPLIINNEGECSLLSQETDCLWMQMSYDPCNKKVKIKCILSHALPPDLHGLQIMMNKLIFDLFKPGSKKGKLVASPESRTLSYISEMILENEETNLLAKLLPQFIQEAQSWKKKLSNALKGSSKKFSHREEEILNFNFQIS